MSCDCLYVIEFPHPGHYWYQCLIGQAMVIVHCKMITALDDLLMLCKHSEFLMVLKLCDIADRQELLMAVTC